MLELTEAQILTLASEAVKRLDAREFEIPLRLDATTALHLIGVLQLVQTHPELSRLSRQMARRLEGVLSSVLEQAEPDLKPIIALRGEGVSDRGAG